VSSCIPEEQKNLFYVLAYKLHNIKKIVAAIYVKNFKGANTVAKVSEHSKVAVVHSLIMRLMQQADLDGYGLTIFTDLNTRIFHNQKTTEGFKLTVKQAVHAAYFDFLKSMGLRTGLGDFGSHGYQIDVTFLYNIEAPKYTGYITKQKVPDKESGNHAMVTHNFVITHGKRTDLFMEPCNICGDICWTSAHQEEHDLYCSVTISVCITLSRTSRSMISTGVQSVSTCIGNQYSWITTIKKNMWPVKSANWHFQTMTTSNSI
jgi:hypothetical protein